MGTQLISFRLKDEEVALLMQYANPDESANLTAQRVIRQVLGTQDIPSDRLTSLLTQVNEFQEQVKSVKVSIDETINERLDAVDSLVDEAVNQHMQAELVQARGRFDKFEQRLDKYFQILRASGQLPPPKKKRSQLLLEPLHPSELAQRLINPKTGHPYSQSAISRQKERVNFPFWSEARDPQGIAWEYDPDDGLFYPLQPS
ncbi:hypothetical protein [Allocoleopsis sp.]|uniref:hypothetical protein n=1 Tax=Allocoleopsis sp. TaxID=3088169 RepID=UPI002FD24199